ncbi:hypothetical protein OPT61_g1389 [Boeremia exigua]|uniref:Uncharacterized protein n=1 Tax=Boeremia exigua TaxID=749465 RepID=A0ACC2IQK3_9PLEO|nr:hypothetical protein OPT61_g1389 [Boeremia exigua]
MAFYTASRPLWLIITFAALPMAQLQTLTDEVGLPDTVVQGSSTSFQSPTTPTSGSTPQTHTIQVGLADHKMRPETTKAAVGDIIEFNFYPVNHSIVRAEYEFPCIPYEMTGSSKQGFFSGFNPVDSVMDNPPRYSVRVNDTEPIFFYCSAPGSCIKYGMVGGINLNSSMSIDKQRTLAMDSAFMLQPGEPFPEENASSTASTVSSSSTTTPISASPTSVSLPPTVSATSIPAAGNSQGSSGLSKGAIAGIVVAVVCALVAGASLFFCWGRTKSLKEEILRRNGGPPDQMGESRQAHRPAQIYTGFPQPGPPTSDGFAHQRNASGIVEYLPAVLPAKYPSPRTSYPAYYAVSSGSPPPGMIPNGQVYMHAHANDQSPTGSPAPTYYESVQRLSRQQEQGIGPIEMEAAAQKA